MLPVTDIATISLSPRPPTTRSLIDPKSGVRPFRPLRFFDAAEKGTTRTSLKTVARLNRPISRLIVVSPTDVAGPLARQQLRCRFVSDKGEERYVIARPITAMDTPVADPPATDRPAIGPLSPLFTAVIEKELGVSPPLP